jgi:hypothetical protein
VDKLSRCQAKSYRHPEKIKARFFFLCFTTHLPRSKWIDSPFGILTCGHGGDGRNQRNKKETPAFSGAARASKDIEEGTILLAVFLFQ